MTVAVLPMDSYLLGVVPNECTASWPAPALQAQPIAARPHTEDHREHAAGAPSDICDSNSCPVFGGTAEFSAGDGGWTTGDGAPYLVTRCDDWGGVVASSVHNWIATVSAAQLQARYPAVGRLLRLRVKGRDGNDEWGGRVLAVSLVGVDSVGAATSVPTTGTGVHLSHNWPSSAESRRLSWWTVDPSLAAQVTAQSVAPSLVHSPGVSTGTLTVQLRNTVPYVHLTVSSPPDPRTRWAAAAPGRGSSPATSAGRRPLAWSRATSRSFASP